MIAWLVDEVREPGARLPAAKLDDEPQAVASSLRDRLGISLTMQLEWSSSEAFDAWRGGVDNLGTVVFLFQLGADNCRGFFISEAFTTPRPAADHDQQRQRRDEARPSSEPLD